MTTCCSDDSVEPDEGIGCRAAAQCKAALGDR